MKFFYGSVRKKLVILVLLATAPALIVLFCTEILNRQYAVEVAKKDNANVLNGFAEVQRRIAQSTMILMRTVASIPEIRDADVEKSRIILSTLLETNPIYTNVILVDAGGDVIAAGKNHEIAKSLNFSDRKQFIEAMSGNGFAAGEFTVGKSSNKNIFPYGMAVMGRNGSPKAVLLIGVSLNHYTDLFKRGDYPENTFIGLCDHKGMRLFRFPFNEKAEPGKPIKKKVFDSALASQQPGSTTAISSDGLKRSIVFEPIRLSSSEPPYMYMFMGFAYEQIVKRANTVIDRLMVTMTLSLGLTLVVAWYIGGRGIAGRVEELTRVTRRFSQGEKHVISDIDYSDGELGDLAQSFDNMVEMLEQRETERNDALQQLSQSEERFRELIEDVAAIAVQGYDENRAVTFWNQASEILYGYTREEALGKHLEDLIVPQEMREDVIRLHSLWLHEGVKIPAGELQLVNKSGETIPVFSSHVMHETLAGKEMFCMDVDMRPIKLAEAEKKQLLQRLSQSQKMDAVGQLAGGIAHDFNNMLAAIMGAAEMLAIYLPDKPEAKKFHQILIKSAGRAADLTGKLLTFSRDSNTEMEPVNLHEIIKETVIILENTLDRRINVELELRATDFFVVGDSSQLQNALLNLGINASHAMPEGGSIIISSVNTDVDEAQCKNSTFVLHRGSHITVNVTDTGVGIPETIIDKVFEPFFSTKGHGKGTGLGLAAVYGTVQQHKGAVTVNSDVAVGTTFQIMLPVTEGRQIETEGKELLYRGEATILLVDDEETIRLTGKSILKSLGYTVLLASNGQEAVEVYAKNAESIDLVVLDMGMPVMNGKDCFKALIGYDPAVRVLLCSGFIDENDLEEMLAVGLKKIIRKPYSVRSLSKTVCEVLN